MGQIEIAILGPPIGHFLDQKSDMEYVPATFHVSRLSCHPYFLVAVVKSPLSISGGGSGARYCVT